MIDANTLKVGDWFVRVSAPNARGERNAAITWHVRAIGDPRVWLEGSDGTHLFLNYDDFIVFAKDGRLP